MPIKEYGRWRFCHQAENIMLEALLVSCDWRFLMPPNPPFVVLNKPCDKAVAWAVQMLEQNGFRPVQTFDLQTARLAHADCPCPHHGTAHCTCQMVVLLVYQGNNLPATMIIHGNTEASWFYIVNTPQQPIGQQVEKHIQDVLNLAIDATI
jgi:hypothetical protein